MNLVIIVAGVAGLAVAGYALVDVLFSAGRRRRLLDVLLLLAAAAAKIAALLTWGDHLLQ